MVRAVLLVAVPLFLAVLLMLRLGGSGEGPALGLFLLALASTGALVVVGARASG